MTLTFSYRTIECKAKSLVVNDVIMKLQNNYSPEKLMDVELEVQINNKFITDNFDVVDFIDAFKVNDILEHIDLETAMKYYHPKVVKEML